MYKIKENNTFTELLTKDDINLGNAKKINCSTYSTTAGSETLVLYIGDGTNSSNFRLVLDSTGIKFQIHKTDRTNVDIFRLHP